MYGRCANDIRKHKRIEDWATDVKRAWWRYQKEDSIKNLIALRDAIDEEYSI